MELAEVDVYDPDNFVAAVPHEMLATLRREAPVYRHPRPDGTFFWCVTRHDDVVHTNRDARLFSSWQGGTNIDVHAENLDSMRLMMLNMDPPEHTKLRKIVNKGFTPRVIRQLSDHLADETRRIVDSIAPKGGCEFVTEVAAELPLIAIAEFLGVPVEDRKVLFDLSNRLIGFDDPEFQTSQEEAGAVAAEMYAYAQELAADRRENPRDDIVTALINAEVDGERLSEMEFNLFFLLLAVAGNETTRNAISHGMLALIENPDQRRALLDDPSLIDGAIEEILRWATPVMHFRRTATEDLEIRGERIEAGDAVVMWHMSANRDEDVFADPYRFDIRRDPNAHTMHVAFGGGGPHLCLGAHQRHQGDAGHVHAVVARSFWRQSCTAPVEICRQDGTGSAGAGAEVGVFEFRGDVAGLAHRHDPPVQHDRRVVRDAEDRAGELLDHQDRHAFPGNSGDDFVKLLDDDRGEPHRQLVEEQQRRIDGETAGEREHLLLTARERAGELAAPLAEPRELPVGPLLDVIHVDAGVGRHAQVLADREVRKDPAPLGDRAHAEPGQRVGIRSVDMAPGDVDAPRRRRHLPAGDLESGRLAATVRTEQCDHRSLGHDEVDAVEHLDTAVRSLHALQLEHRRGGAHDSWTSAPR